MPKVLDDHNVHHFWGLSPAIDLAEAADSSGSDAPVCVLQVTLETSLEPCDRAWQYAKAGQSHGQVTIFCSYIVNQELDCSALQLGAHDCRHTARTLACLSKHAWTRDRPVHLYIVEDEAEVLARHLLLLCALLDRSLPVKTRVETFLELHGNALLQQRTAEYAGELLQLG